MQVLVQVLYLDVFGWTSAAQADWVPDRLLTNFVRCRLRRIVSPSVTMPLNRTQPSARWAESRSMLLYDSLLSYTSEI